MFLNDGVVSSFLEIHLSTCCTLTFTLGYLGSIRFWEVAAEVMRRNILEPICLKAEARTEHRAFPSAQKAGNSWFEI